MNPTNTNRAETFYITGGNVPADALSYVTRDADALLLQSLLRGEFCYILTSRQMGKSSLMTQMVKRLREHNVAPAVLDLSNQGFNLDARQWYNGLLEQLGRRLKLDDEIEDFCRDHSHLSPLQRWQQALRDVVLAAIPGQVVIFIDEIDVVRSLPFSTDEFFAAIRACYNARTEDPTFARLSFCLLGVATPADLISNPKLTPFNIGTRIELTDFSREEARSLEVGLGQDAETNRMLMDRIYHWTGGHPYLTQRLCQAVAADDAHLTERSVDGCAERLFLSVKAQRQDSNLSFVQQRMLPMDEEQRVGLLTLYAKVLSGKPVLDSDTVAYVSELKLAGIVQAVKGQLQVRNRIYAQVFDRAWISENMPGAELRRQRAAYRRGLLLAGGLAGTVLAIIGSLAFIAASQANRATKIATRERLARIAADNNAERADRIAYIANMNLVQSDWENNNIAHVVERLADTSQYVHKGFEWGFWNRVAHLDLMTLKGIHTIVTSVAFSPDDRWIVTTENGLIMRIYDDTDGRVWPQGGGLVRLWDARTGQEALKGRSLGDASVAFAPDGQRIVTGSDDGTIRVWDLLTCREILNLNRPIKVKGHTASVGSVAFSPDSRRIVTWSDDAPAKVRDVRTGRTILTLASPGVFGYSVAFSPNNQRIVTVGGGLVRLWNAETGRAMFTLKGLDEFVSAAVFSPDGNRIVTADWDQPTKVWDAQTGREAVALQGHSDHVYSVAFSPDGRHIVTGTGSFGHSGEAIVWDARTGRVVMTLKGHTDFVTSVAFSPDGQHIVTGSMDGTIRVWNAQSGDEIVKLKGHSGSITSVAFSHDGSRIVTGSGNNSQRGEVKVWDAKISRETLTFNGYSGKSNSGLFSYDDISSVTFSADSKRILTGSRDNKVKIWDAESGHEVLTLQDASSPVFSPDGKRIVTGCSDKTAKVWDAQTGRKLLTLKGHTFPIASISFSPDGQRIVTGSGWDNDKGEAKVWSAQTGRETVTLQGHTGCIYSVAFSPDGQHIAIADSGIGHPGYSGEATVWDVRTGREEHALKGHTNRVRSVAFSPDGQRIITGSEDTTAKVWDVWTGREIMALKGHTVPVFAVAYSADGQRIVTGGGSEFGNGEAKLWDALTGREILALPGIKKTVSAVAFSPDSRQLVAASGSVVKVWFSDPNDWKVAMRDTMEANVHLSHAETLASAKKYDEAVAEYRSALRICPTVGSDTVADSILKPLANAGNPARVLARAQQLLTFDPTIKRTVALQLNTAAWNVVDPDAKVKASPDRVAAAVPAAERAVALTDHRNAAILDTLAAAYFANGDARRAAETEMTAIQLNSDPANLAVFKKNLARFKGNTALPGTAPSSTSPEPAPATRR